MIFVVGNSRSGTTMMGRILGRHPDIFTFGELHFFEQIVSPKQLAICSDLANHDSIGILATLFSIQRDGFLAIRNPDKFKKEAKALLNSYQGKKDFAGLFKAFLLSESNKHGKRIPCEQTPRNIFYLKEIFYLYPDAKVINMIRDPRDVLLSQKNKWKRRFLGAKTIPIKEAFRSWINYHPITIAMLWNASIRAFSRFEHDSRMTSVRFEDILGRPEVEINRVCEFLGVKYQLAMLDVPQIGSSLGNDHPEKKGINATATGGWRKGGLSSTEIALCQWGTAKWMGNLYITNPVQINWLSMGIYVATFPIKILFALLFNLGRTRNLIQTIRRRLNV